MTYHSHFCIISLCTLFSLLSLCSYKAEDGRVMSVPVWVGEKDRKGPAYEQNAVSQTEEDA